MDVNRVFRDSACLVTGAASGIGQALAEALAGAGARVLATDIDEARLQEVVAPLREQGRTVTARKLDVTDAEAFESTIHGMVDEWGRIDYIFNNAGIAIAGEVRDTGLEHWNRVLDVNLDGVVHGSLFAYKQMVKQGSGHIVNIASAEGLWGFPLTVSYVTAKFGVVGLSQGLWIEGKDLGVDVSVVCPGYIRTNIFSSVRMVNFDRSVMLEAFETFDRFGIDPDECARVILKGVAKKKPIIIVTGLARVLWWIARLSPTFMLNFARKDFARWRHRGRLADT